MNRNVMIVLAGGFLIAILVALLVQASLGGGKSAEPVAIKEEPKVKIVVASKDLKTGDELSDDNMKWQDWPKNAVFPGAIQQEEDKNPLEMVEGVLSRPVKAGEPILESALVGKASNFVSASLGDGMRAFTINVKAADMVGGFATPGDYVDVILTYRKTISYNGPDSDEVSNVLELNIDNYAAETIMQNVKVLAVDQSPTKNEEGAIKVGKTVTLEVDFKGAEVLALAEEMGDIRLALRKLGDEKIVAKEYPITTDARITKVEDEILDEIYKTQLNSGKISNIVRIYSGGNVQDVSVGP